jgi:glycosyltransferase involved in cell wall biosynthesis
MLREAVSSVITQTVPEIEIVVVSDGSSDPMDDLEDLDPRVRLIRCRHRGVSAARNTGLVESRSEMVAFLDDDDVCMPHRIARQLDSLDETPDAAMSYSAVEVVDLEGGPVWSGAGAHTDYLGMLRGRFVTMSSVMVRKRPALIAGGFSTVLDTGEDFDFQLRMAKNFDTVFIPDALVIHRRHAQNTSITPWRASGDLDAILRAHRRWARRSGNTEVAAAAKEGMRKSHRNLARNSAHRALRAGGAGQAREMVRYAATSLCIDPRVLPRELLGAVIDKARA